MESEWELYKGMFDLCDTGLATIKGPVAKSNHEVSNSKFITTSTF